MLQSWSLSTKRKGYNKKPFKTQHSVTAGKYTPKKQMSKVIPEMLRCVSLLTGRHAFVEPVAAEEVLVVRTTSLLS